jgi:hypothetical protein
MAIDVKTSRVLVLSALIVGAVGLAFNFTLSRTALPALPATCAAIPPNIKLIGPSLDVAQVEAQSLAGIKNASPTVPRVPFGGLNPEWVALKRLTKPGDKLYEFRAGVTGGHVVLRQRCFVGQITEWMR